MFRVKIRVEYTSGVIVDWLHIRAHCEEDARRTAADEVMNRYGMSDKDSLIEIRICEISRCA